MLTCMASNDTSYTRSSCHNGLANSVQIVSTPPAPSNGDPITVFWASRPCGPAGRLAMLLIEAGDVETIPGSTTTHKQIFTNIIQMADKHNIPKGKIHSNYRLLPYCIVCKITQGNIRRANTCDPAVLITCS